VTVKARMKQEHREALNGAIWLILFGYWIWAAMAEGAWHLVGAALALIAAVLNLWPLVSRRRRSVSPS
jgi:hypothetical protein